MEKYSRVEKPREKAPDNEVRINKKTPMTNYVKYIISQFKDKNANEVTIKSMGDAISKITTIAEIIKYRVKGLHQVNNIGTQEFEDIYEPIEEGLDKLIFSRKVTSLTILLTKIPQD
jgi:ribonuclease P/MRP protein subunit RPP25